MSHKSTRILLFTTAFRPFIGGSEIAIEEVARRIPELHFDIVTPRYDSSLPWRETSGNITIYRLGIGSLLDKFIFPATGLIVGLWLYAQKRHLAIHAYQASFAGIAAVLTHSILFTVPFVVTLQEGKELNNQNLLIRKTREYILRQAKAITAISNYLLNFARSVNSKAIIERIPNGIDTELFHKINGDRAKLNITPEQKVIITISRLVEKNGVEDLIRAFHKVLATIPDARLLIIGEDALGERPLRSHLLSLTKSLEIESKVQFLGSVPYNKLPEYLSMADVFVRPSHSEGLGNVFIEAMACQVPVIGTPVGGIPDFLKEGITGLMAEAKDPTNLASKIVQMLNDKELSSHVKNNAFALVRDEYTWQSIANKFKDLYARF